MNSLGHCVTVFLLSVWVHESHSVCDNNIVADFKKLWGNKAPTNLMEWAVGRTTYVLGDDNFWKNYKTVGKEEVMCLQTVVDKDQVDTWDEYYTNSSKTPAVSTYSMIMEEPGVYTVINPETEDAYIYVFYLKNDVMAYYECSVKDKTYVYGSTILVKNFKLGDKNQAAEVEEAKKYLKNVKAFKNLHSLSTKGCK